MLRYIDSTYVKLNIDWWLQRKFVKSMVLHIDRTLYRRSTHRGNTISMVRYISIILYIDGIETVTSIARYSKNLLNMLYMARTLHRRSTRQRTVYRCYATSIVRYIDGRGSENVIDWLLQWKFVTRRYATAMRRFIEGIYIDVPYCDGTQHWW